MLMSLCSTFAMAGTPVDTQADQRQAAKIVSRLYQATYGASERCKKATSDANAEFQRELSRFIEAEAQLMKLVTRSPYYSTARDEFAKYGAMDPARDTPESLAGDCKYLAELLRSLSQTPAGKSSIHQYEKLLSGS